MTELNVGDLMVVEDERKGGESLHGRVVRIVDDDYRKDNVWVGLNPGSNYGTLVMVPRSRLRPFNSRDEVVVQNMDERP